MTGGGGGKCSAPAHGIYQLRKLLLIRKRVFTSYAHVRSAGMFSELRLRGTLRYVTRKELIQSTITDFVRRVNVRAHTSLRDLYEIQRVTPVRVELNCHHAMPSGPVCENTG
jgi:hypothetical protein